MTDNIVEQIVGSWVPLKVNGVLLAAYEVLSKEEIRLKKTRRILGYKNNGKPWPYVILTIDNKQCRIPRANISQDIEFVYTETGNCLQKLTANQVLEIKKQLAEGSSTVIIAASFKVDRRTISDIKHDQSWTHIQIQKDKAL